MQQYPDHIVVTWTGKPVKNPVTGNYTPAIPQTFESDCRIEANDRSRKVTGTDGNLIDYSYDCFMPLPETIVNIPAFVAEFIASGDSVGEIMGKVKRHKNNQFNSRIWL